MAGSSYNIDEAAEIFSADNDGEVRVLTVGVYETADKNSSEDEFLYSMEELKALVSACDMTPVGMVTQNLEHSVKALYVGTGKVSEIRTAADTLEADLIVFNDTLSPSQYRNLQKELKKPVMDRTALIIEIFKRRARSREAMLQVEYARLSYIKTRLVGMWDTLGRKGGASGSMSSRGEGETQLELDRRAIDKKLAFLRRELKVVTKEREVRRKKREKSGTKLASLIGYTNAGKSTIMNALVSKYSSDEYAFGSEQKKVFEADMLFATLDSSVRKIVPDTMGDFLLSDTVGFIHKLPTTLVEAFKSTLEEAGQADLLVIVVDRSDEHYKVHMEVTEQILAELGAGDIPRIVVYNKADKCEVSVKYPALGASKREGGSEGGEQKSIYISAHDEKSIEMLATLIAEELYGKQIEAVFMIPYDRGNVVNDLMLNSTVKETEYTENGTKLTVSCTENMIEKYNELVIF